MNRCGKDLTGKVTTPLVCCLALTLAMASGLDAQHRADASVWWESSSTTDAVAGLAPASLSLPAVQDDVIPTIALAGAGMVGSVVGGTAGLLAAAGISYLRFEAGHPSDTADDIALILLGMSGGGALGVPLAVHLVNGRRGSYWKSALWSFGVAGAGFGLAPFTGGLSLVAIPFGQTYTSIRVERAAEQVAAPNK